MASQTKTRFSVLKHNSEEYHTSIKKAALSNIKPLQFCSTLFSFSLFSQTLCYYANVCLPSIDSLYHISGAEAAECISPPKQYI